MKELSMNVTLVNIDLLHWAIFYITYSHDMKELGLIITNVNISTNKGNVALHIQSVLEGAMYECNKYEYRSATQGNLICYIQQVNKEAKYDCN